MYALMDSTRPSVLLTMSVFYSRSCIILSALSYAFPFLFPDYCAELIFLALIPLYSLHNAGRLKFYQGFLWGIIFYILYAFGFIVLCLEQGSGFGKYALALAVIFYGAFLSGCWFWLVGQLCRFSKQGSFIAGTFLFWFFIDQAFFLPTGKLFGNTLQNPLLPLMVRPIWLHSQKFIPEWAGWLSILLITLLFFYSSDKRKSYVALMYLGIVGIGFILIKKEPPKFFNNIILCKVQKNATIYERVREIEEIMEEHEHKILVLPETTLPCFLNENLWIVESLNHSTNILILGSHSREMNQARNSLFVIEQSRITQRYDKQQCMPFTESLPDYYIFSSLIKKIFLHNKECFYESKNKRNIFSLKGIRFLPVICSELFFHADELKNQIKQTDCLIAIANDSWFSWRYFPYLMLLQAKRVGKILGKPVIYCAWGHQELI